MTAAETRYKACFFCEGERGTNYSVSELGGFAGSALAELTGRADIGRQKDEEAKKKAEAEAAKNKSGQNGPPVSAAEGFVNALGAGLIRIKNDLKDLWDGLKGIGESVKNWSDDKGFMTDDEVTTKLDELKMKKLDLESKTKLAYLDNGGDGIVMSDGTDTVSAEGAAKRAADELRITEEEIKKLESPDKGLLSSIGSAIVNFPESIKNKFLCGVYGLNGEADVLDAKYDKVKNQVREMTSERAKGNVYYEALKNDKIFSVRLYEAITSGTTLEGEANMMLNALLKFAPELAKDMQDMNAAHGRVGQGSSPIQREDYASESDYKDAQKQFVKDMLKDYTKAYLKEHKDAALSWIKRDAALNGMSDSTAIFGGVAVLAYIGLGGKVSVNTDKVQASAQIDAIEKTFEAHVNVDTTYVDVVFNAEKNKKTDFEETKQKEDVISIEGEVSVLLKGNDAYLKGFFKKDNTDATVTELGGGIRTFVRKIQTVVKLGIGVERRKDKNGKKENQVKVEFGANKDF